jgi:hypothetical protein
VCSKEKSVLNFNYIISKEKHILKYVVRVREIHVEVVL